ncbi:MAG: glycosyltransferase family 9 protein [Bdellovibrionaceae bacterium]|nr:glycosyltransferase family 9 protein [Pseudobdellovibrionaceae bacterium]
MQSKTKVLLIRFSSFGDVTQALSLPSKLKEHFQNAEIHWVTREDYKSLLEDHPHIDRIWLFNRKKGFVSLAKLAWQLRQQNFTHVYDAHNNLRSLVIYTLTTFLKFNQKIRRPIYRWRRFLLFKLRINRFEMPFSGQRDLIEPLQGWGINKHLPTAPQIFLQPATESKALEKIHSLRRPFFTLAPSAAYFLKRWPKDYWKELIRLLPEYDFVLLGGPEDQFLKDIVAEAPNRCLNLAGALDYKTNAAIIKKSKALVSNDTGLMHIAEQLGHPCLALLGPAPFGFPSRSSTLKMELPLACRPCSKHGQGPCVNPYHHQCLVDIKPQTVATELLKWIG